MSEMSAEKTPGVVVVEQGGRERRYAASGFGHHEDGTLGVGSSDNGGALAAVAEYAPGAWLSVRQEGAIADDATKHKLGIALGALEGIRRIVRAVPPQPGDVERPPVALVAVESIAKSLDEALADIADVDL